VAGLRDLISETRTWCMFFDLLEELSGSLIMESERFELSGVVVDRGLLQCDVVLLVLWFLIF